MKGEMYVGNRKNMSFHSSDCLYAPKKMDKRVVFNSRSEAYEQGYQPCSNCLELLEGEVIGNKERQKYHKQDCKYAPKSPSKRIVFENAESAEKNGYEACGICHSEKRKNKRKKKSFDRK